MKTAFLHFSFALLLIGGLSQAQQYTIGFSSVGIGGTLTGNGYSLYGTIGESAAGFQSSAQGYTLAGGFVPGSEATIAPQWVLRATNGPPARFGHAMAYDSARAVTVLFGGGKLSDDRSKYEDFGDLWEWNGAQWQQRTTSSLTSGWAQVTGRWAPTYGDVPVPRRQHAMSYDGKRERIVLFGGRADSPDGFDTFLSDTWEWDGLRWQFRATNGPVSRISHAMAYDASRGVTVLYGGFSTGDYGIVWEWDGASWKSIQPTNGPATNYSQDAGSMAYDSTSHEVFFGPTTDGFRLRFFWSWDGHDWHDRGTGFTPTIISPPYGAMIFDTFRQEFVCFGGQNGYQNFFGGNTTAFLRPASAPVGMWTLLPAGSEASLFSEPDFVNLSDLVTKLNAHADPVSLFLWNQFSPETQQTLADVNATPDQFKTVLITNLNAIVMSNSVFEASRFAAVSLSPETQVLQRLNPQGPDLIRFNRLLLEDAYSLDLGRSPSVPSGRMRHAVAYDSQRHALVTMGGVYDPGSAFQLVGNETWELLTPDELLIDEQPLGQFRPAGDNAVFKVVARSRNGAALNYQWFFGNQSLSDGGRISGASTASLQIANVTQIDAGQYRVRVSDDRGSVQSSPARLTLEPRLQIFSGVSSEAFRLMWGSPNTLLEHSDTVSSNWTGVPGAASPFDITVYGPGKFFRLRQAGP